MALGLILVIAALVTLSSGIYYAILLSSADEMEGTADISGTYYNSRDKRVEGAVVRVEGTDIRGLTDAKGRYELEDVPGGARTIVFERGGYPTVRVRQLIIPSDNLADLESGGNTLNIPDNLVGGVLVEKPSYTYELHENVLGRSNLTGCLIIDGMPLSGATVTLHNDTLNATSDGTGCFELENIYPGIVLLNVSVAGELHHAAAFLSEGDNNVTFDKDGNVKNFRTTDGLGMASGGTGLVEENVSFGIVDDEGGGVRGAAIVLEALSHNEVNRTILADIPPFDQWLTKSERTLNGKDDIPLIPGNLYAVEVASPGLGSVIFWNLTLNGSRSIDVTLGPSLGTDRYTYSLAGFLVAMIFHFLVTMVIIWGLPAAFGGRNFPRVITAAIAAFVSSASLPLGQLTLPLAHNWILGGGAIVILLLKRNWFTGKGGGTDKGGDN